MTHAAVLVLRTAPAALLRAYARRHSPDDPFTVLGQQVDDMPSGATLIPAPEGRLSWRRLAPTVRATLRSQRWREIVVLHNQGDDSYAQVYWVAARIGLWTPLRIVYQDGTWRAHQSVTSYGLRRLPLVCAGSIAIAALVVAAWCFTRVTGVARTVPAGGSP